jgi:hypothetical protein
LFPRSHMSQESFSHSPRREGPGWLPSKKTASNPEDILDVLSGHSGSSKSSVASGLTTGDKPTPFTPNARPPPKGARLTGPSRPKKICRPSGPCPCQASKHPSCKGGTCPWLGSSQAGHKSETYLTTVRVRSQTGRLPKQGKGGLLDD